jgi:molecular chaperone GrpE
MLRKKKKNTVKEKEPIPEKEVVDQTMADTGVKDENDTGGGDDSSVNQELSEIKDKYLRLLAEFENYKKRTFREKLDTINTAARDTMLAILPVLDDFDRAKSMADDETTEETFSEGVLLVYNKLHAVVKNKGHKAMESTGQIFDAELHEAVTEIPAPSDAQKGMIIDTIEKGYTLNDKIIRHAKVVVGK